VRHGPAGDRVVTNVGFTHMQFFRHPRQPGPGKGELLESLPRKGRAVINADDDYADLMRELSPALW